jgi:hypothetical protein
MSRRRSLVDKLASMVKDDNLDLWLLVVAAMAFTVLGITGLASQSLLSSAILALLALLSTAQIRLRRHVAEMAADNRRDSFAVLGTSFPEDLIEKRRNAGDLLLIGHDLSRTVQTLRMTLGDSLASGARIRVLVADPELFPDTDAPGLEASETSARRRRRIQVTLAELSDLLRTNPDGALQIRTASFLSSMGITAIDSASPDGRLIIQHYEFRPVGESQPILNFHARDGYWYHRYLSEAERMWNAGNFWPKESRTVEGGS